MEYIRARAPLRIGFAGGGTDVDPYAGEKGGYVFNTTINKYAYCTLVPRKDKTMSVTSSYYGRFDTSLNKGPLKLDGNMDLIKAVANHFDIKDGFDVQIHSDAPAGSGLGGSSAMMVAMVEAMANWIDEEMSRDSIARLSHYLEREVVGIAGGKQDQYSSVFGGFNSMIFENGAVRIKPLRLDKNVVNELQCRSILCYSGSPRNSSDIIKTQISAYKKGTNEAALDQSKVLAHKIRDALGIGDFDGMGKLLDEAWQYKKQFSENVTNDTIDGLYKTAIDHGAIGGKVSGAGGGGFMYFVCGYDDKVQVAEALKAQGANIADFMFEPQGAISWRSNNE